MTQKTFAILLTFMACLILFQIIHNVAKDAAKTKRDIIAMYIENLDDQDAEFIENICGMVDVKCWNRERAILSGMTIKERVSFSLVGKVATRRIKTDYIKDGVVVYTED